MTIDPKIFPLFTKRLPRNCLSMERPYNCKFGAKFGAKVTNSNESHTDKMSVEKLINMQLSCKLSSRAGGYFL